MITPYIDKHQSNAINYDQCRYASAMNFCPKQKDQCILKYLTLLRFDLFLKVP